MSIVNLKIFFLKNLKQTGERPTQGRGGGENSFVTEMTVFFVWDGLWRCMSTDSRQIRNTSQFELERVLILNEQSAWIYPSILTDSLKMDYPFQIACVQPPPPLRKNRRRGVCRGGGCCTQGNLSPQTDNPFLALVWKQNSRVQCF